MIDPDQTPDPEDIEKVRQELMRLHELLKLTRKMLEAGERAYLSLFPDMSPATIDSVKHKDVQWIVAEAMVYDSALLRRIVCEMTFTMHNLQLGFAELRDIISSNQYPE